MPPESPTNPVPLKVEYIAPDNIAIKGNNPKQSKNIHNTRFLFIVKIIENIIIAIVKAIL